MVWGWGCTRRGSFSSSTTATRGGHLREARGFVHGETSYQQTIEQFELVRSKGYFTQREFLESHSVCQKTGVVERSAQLTSDIWVVPPRLVHSNGDKTIEHP
jgi:hypothetical protein